MFVEPYIPNHNIAVIHLAGLDQDRSDLNITHKIETLDKNIIEELLSTLVSTTLLELEIKDFEILVSEETLLKKIKTNKNFQNDLYNPE